jgi:hypothetical protein
MKTTTVLNAITALNLEPIKTKLMDAATGEGWSQATADAMDIEYRRFLHLMHAYPNARVSPSKAVDTFWHYHILDTQRYAADCDRVFGCFMHHDPYGDAGEPAADAGLSMQQLYEATFGDTYPGPSTHGEGASAARCMALCMMQAKQDQQDQQGQQGQLEGAARCMALCMMQAKQSQAARCMALCMMQAKPAGTHEAIDLSRGAAPEPGGAMDFARGAQRPPALQAGQA